MTGFHSKQDMAAGKLQEPEHEALKLALEALKNMVSAQSNPNRRDFPTIHDFGLAGRALSAANELLAQPARERQWIWLSDADIAEVVDTTCQYTGSYEQYLIKKAERKIRSMNNE
jgi:hypothetical protein